MCAGRDEEDGDCLGFDDIMGVDVVDDVAIDLLLRESSVLSSSESCGIEMFC